MSVRHPGVLPRLATQAEHDARNEAIKAEARVMCQAAGWPPDRLERVDGDPNWFFYYHDAAGRLGLLIYPESPHAC